MDVCLTGRMRDRQCRKNGAVDDQGHHGLLGDQRPQQPGRAAMLHRQLVVAGERALANQPPYMAPLPEGRRSQAQQAPDGA
jgi:hypothetical protein